VYRIPRWTLFLLIGGALAAGRWSIRTAVADYQMRRETVEAIEEAIALSPDNAEYYARLAWLESDSDPKKSKDALRRAVALNPSDAGSWIELGLVAEAEGDDTVAKQCLLRATEVDTKFLPRWTLANYYFRHHDERMFWQWMKKAVPMAYGDALPLYRLCGKVEENGSLIERLEIQNPDVRAGYLTYLLNEKRVDLAGPAVDRLLEENREVDVPLLLAACEKFLDAGREDEAAAVWNRLAKSGRVVGRAEENEPEVVNGSFAMTPTSRGFDWHMPAVEGISIAREGDQGSLRVTFSGHEPEQMEALAQLVPLRSNSRYELLVDYRTQGIASGAGLDWRITDARSGALLREGLSLASETDIVGRLPFETSGECRLVRLTLCYHRAPGTIRLEGFLILRNVALKASAYSPIEGGRVRR
jgi:hypothetical protein